MNEEAVVQGLAALAHEHRLRVYRALVVAGSEGLTPGAMAGICGIAPATLSFHLKELLHAGLATQKRQGRHLVYRADYGCMNAVMGYLTQNCCRGEPCALATAGAGACA